MPLSLSTPTHYSLTLLPSEKYNSSDNIRLTPLSLKSQEIFITNYIAQLPTPSLKTLRIIPLALLLKA
ncbi:hypothetical protein PCASD_02344 [Puccinia coronata f. sp. avenae]|nr:hypothetical protein PCASD_22351 [Puccinia coronata f. sp. avenae]PLW47209.1 hypothetical protein PCASD_02344 [Puccinia coronata f. sp. avenae]